MGAIYAQVISLSTVSGQSRAVWHGVPCIAVGKIDPYGLLSIDHSSQSMLTPLFADSEMDYLDLDILDCTSLKSRFLLRDKSSAIRYKTQTRPQWISLEKTNFSYSK